MMFDHIGADQGLSHFTPTVIVQDKQGFLWFGTEDGLNRYDGHNFVVFRKSRRDTNTITTNYITGLCVDPDGNVWMTSWSAHVQRYDVNTDKFVKYKLAHRDLPAGESLLAWRIFADDDGVIWVTTNSALIKFNARSGTVERVFVHDPTNPSSLAGNDVRAVCKDSSDNIWVGTGKGLSRLEKQSQSMTSYFPSKTLGFPAVYDSVVSLAVDNRGVVWIGTGGGLLRFDQRTQRFIPSTYKLSSGNILGKITIFCLFVDDHGVLWVGTNEGLLKHVPASETFIQQRHDPKNPRSIARDLITCMYQDRSGVLWVGMYRAGLSRYSRKRDQFTHYASGSDVYAVCEDFLGDLWIGTSEGRILRYKKGTVIPETLRHAPKNPNPLYDYSVYALQEEANGDMWIGSAYGLERYTRATRTFTHYKSGGSQTRGVETKAVYRDKDGEIWAGTFGIGLLRYNKTTGRFVNYRHDPNNPQSISVGGVWWIYHDSMKRLWVASLHGGLNVFDKRTNTFSHLVHEDRDANYVYCITEDVQGSLWVGTFGYGLNRLDTTTWKFKTYNVEDGLPDNFIKTILIDSLGRLWMSTDKGISCFDVSAVRFTNYKENDGLHGNIFLSGSAFKNPQGRLYFGGHNGVTAFHPDSLNKSSHTPSIVITNFKVFDETVPSMGRFVSDPTLTMSLGYLENFFSFEFFSADFSAPDKNQFAYKLEGLDRDWIQAGTRRYASYTHVPAGDYTFKVKGTNSDGVWSPNVTSMHIVVVPPPWERWWFRLGAAVLLLGIGVAAYNYRVNRLLEIERLRIRIASDLHDDVGSSLTRISLQSELIQEGIEPEEQQNYLKSIAAMSRDLVTSMSDIVWSIDSRNDSMENILDKMRNFGSTVLSARDVRFNLSHSGLDLKKKLSVDVRQNLYLIYKEAISNVAKHANASSVDVVLRNDSDKFTMTVIDNGKGWEGNERLNGHGTKNMKMRAERLGGRVEFVRDEGTRVLLTIKKL